MANRRDILVPGKFYHIYNRANAEDQLFTENVEFYLFLKKYFRYSSLIFSTYGYCLLPNHFHLLVQVLPEHELNRHIGLFKDDKSRSNYLAQHLGNFFNWYATYFNKKHFRKGSLFIHTFHRKPIQDQKHLCSLICYIHANPLRAGLCEKMEEWQFSSFGEFVKKPQFITDKNKEQTLEWFDGLENFIFTHSLYVESV
jgi:putative transposase